MALSGQVISSTASPAAPPKLVHFYNDVFAYKRMGVRHHSNDASVHQSYTAMHIQLEFVAVHRHSNRQASLLPFRLTARYFRRLTPRFDILERPPWTTAFPMYINLRFARHENRDHPFAFVAKLTSRDSESSLRPVSPHLTSPPPRSHGTPLILVRAWPVLYLISLRLLSSGLPYDSVSLQHKFGMKSTQAHEKKLYLPSSGMGSARIVGLSHMV
jgi:hypothetical protein